MNKFKILVIGIIVFSFSGLMEVNAASASLSVSTENVSVGDSFTVFVNINESAAWNIQVNPSGPVTGCVIKEADATKDALNASEQLSATCTATQEGKITISLSGDVTNATDGNYVDVSGTKVVNVTKKTAQSSSSQSLNNSKPSNNSNKNNKQNTTSTTINDNLSTNNNIKSLTIDDYELTKEDNNNYTLTVSNDVTSINVNANAEDSKAKVTGTGVKDLQVGENNIEVVVTSESGAQNKINIKVTRKDGYYLEDLDSVLKNTKLKDADIIINTDSKITAEQINKIKESKKNLKLNYYDQNKKLIYSWIINGKEIKNSKEFTTAITYTSENIKEIYKLSNYADGIHINFKHSGDLPSGTKIKLYVGDKFEDGSIVNLYHYDNAGKTLDFIKDGIEVKEGYIEFDIEHCSEYFVTMSTIGNIEKKESSLNIFVIFTIIELIVIISLVVLIFIKIKQNKNNDLNKETTKTTENNNLNVEPLKPMANNNLNEEPSKPIENNNFNTFNSIKSNKELGTNVNNSSIINNNMNSLNNNVNGVQNLNNSNMDSSNNNNIYK